MEQFFSTLNDIVWNPVLVVLLLLAGLYFSFRTRFLQVRRLRLMVSTLFGNKEGDDGISSFQAFCLALSGRVGTGNIVGVAAAIAFGGPGAVFWMWMVAFLGASTAFVESTLAQIYKFPHSSGFRGGPFTFYEKGLGKRWPGVLLAVITILSSGIFLTGVQANGVSSTLSNAFSVPPLVTGLALAALTALVVIGGVHRIAKVAAFVTPIMAAGYILLSLVVVSVHIHEVPAMFSLIFRSAFGMDPLFGGILGSTISLGVKRGLFSNEAGQGTGAIVSAAADVHNPAQQGLAQAFSVYVDTLLVCTATALMILTSGTYNVMDANGTVVVSHAPALGENYTAFTQSAVDTVFPGFGSEFVAVAMLFFVFTTLLAYYFYAESSILYLFRKRAPLWEKVSVRGLQAILLASIVFGSVKDANLVWKMGDIGVGLMAWLTVIAIIILFPKALKALKDFEEELKSKKE